jgi:hypothetical protein
MHGTINVEYPNNISKWQMGFNSAFKGLINNSHNKNNKNPNVKFDVHSAVLLM